MDDDRDLDALIAAVRQRIDIMEMMLPEWKDHLRTSRAKLDHLERLATQRRRRFVPSKSKPAKKAR